MEINLNISTFWCPLNLWMCVDSSMHTKKYMKKEEGRKRGLGRGRRRGGRDGGLGECIIERRERDQQPP